MRRGHPGQRRCRFVALVGHAVGMVEHVEAPADALDRLVVEAHGSRDVFQAAGQWIGGRLASEGFAWIKSRRCWERRCGFRRDRITFASSYKNRVGVGTDVWPESLQVMDAGLGKWRDANPELTFVRPDSVHDIVCASNYLDHAAGRSRVDLMSPSARLEHLVFAVNQLRTIVLPWFASTGDVGRLVETVPDRLLADFGVDLVEYAVSRDRRDQARQLVERALALRSPLHAEFELGQDMARRGERARWHSKSALGWSSTVLGLLE